MAEQIFPASGLPIRRTVDLLPQIFKTDTNSKFMAAVVDPLVQPGVLDKTVGYVGRRYGKTYKGTDVYLDSDNTLRSRYQLEPGVVVKNNETIEKFYDYLDFKNQLRFFNNYTERDDLVTSQDHYSWNPPIHWDKFVNFREYYWVPSGPPSVKILGQGNEIVSTYRVRQGQTQTWIFYPDGQTNNPTLTLYRGQTYKFNINSPREGMYIRTAYDTGSLKYNPILTYYATQIVIYDDKLWRAKTTVAPSVNGVVVEGPEWELVTDNAQTSKFDYNNGVTNNGETNGTITFEVPLDAPDVLFYQSATNPDRFGRFTIADIEDNTSIDLDKEIIGKESYTSNNGVEFTNGLIVRFSGKVTPTKYAKDNWLVESVGTGIKLIKFSDLEVPIVTSKIPEVIFDNGGFDTEPFDDATAYPGEKDYLTICRGSIDLNPWSRYNRWFHKSVLETAHRLNGTDFDSLDSARAKRPIIEFKPNLQLFNHGAIAKTPVDFIDTFTSDVFSTIEGSTGYYVDGEELFQGARILVTADSDTLANNKIYQVNFITHNGVKQITLRTTTDSESLLGEGVLVKRGNVHKGLMYHYNGSVWTSSQQKTTVNQEPLFDLFDSNGISFGDATTYPVSSFNGTPLVGYVPGSSTLDSELGFSLSYLNIDNVGDIVFKFYLDAESFTYSVDQVSTTTKLNTGYFRFNPDDTYDNGWLKTDANYLQPIIDSQIIAEVTASVTFSTVNWLAFVEEGSTILFYLNGILHKDSYTRNKGTFTFANSFAVNDTVSIKIFSNIDPDQGYYQIPLGLEKNPLNQNLSTFTLGQATDHVSTAVELDSRFTGAYPGASNLRDLEGYQNKSTRFLKHSGLAPIAISLLCDKEINIVKAIEHSLKSYSNFKTEFIRVAQTLYFQDDIPAFVDEIISEMGASKNSSNPFADTDMIGSGAHTTINYTVEDEGITVFALSEKFDLLSLNRKAVYVYLNGAQLLYKTDYDFDSTFGFVRILTTLAENDNIQIKEYVSTSFNYIPATPTKLGLYKKYTPKIFTDDTFVVPRTMIQGHDGSLITAFGDYLDDLILELELRIYNNIKQEYDESIFDIDNILGGYYGNALYTKAETDAIVAQEFLKWSSNTDLDYTDNTAYFDRQNSFTYTYSNMTNSEGTLSLPGYWRGVYLWYYDTARPHSHPWEILGFSEKPTWWESEYGPAPYTSGNLVLWEDIQDGIIRQGPRAGTYPRYARSSILNHIPVDGDGNLLSPLDSGLAGNFTLSNNAGNFKIGDSGPVEYSWRTSSEWPFAVMIALSLMKPFEFITDSFDRSRLTVNTLGQTVVKSTGLFLQASDIVIPAVGGNQVAGLLNFVSSFIISNNNDPAVLLERLSNIDVQLSTRMSGFVDQTEQKYLLDSKNPKAASSSIFVPPENYDIIFNVSAPIANLAYSGVMLEKLSTGWKIRGYDNQAPYFNYYRAVNSTVDPLITVGGKSEKFLDWTAGKIYNNGTLVRIQNKYYRATKTHTAGNVFDDSNWKFIPKLPMVGGVDAYFRRTFDKIRVHQVVYDTVLTTPQAVVDFLLGYEAYLKDIGFKFERYDAENQVAYNWQTSAKEFLFWTKHNWAEGSLLTLSPSANELELGIPSGVSDNLFDSFYDYQILKSDGTPLLPIFINVNRDFQQVKVSTVNTTDGIYFIRVHFVLKEHVTLFDDRTVFNDVIYDKTTGYRQERIKSRGFRTVDWDGDYTSPGFLFDNVNIVNWAPYTDYRLGDIVSYRSYNWTSLETQTGSETFDDTKWSKLDTTPTKGLVSNFDYRINQFADYYDSDSDGLGSSQRELSRHVIGYQTRDYLQNLAEDNVSQFKLYQGFIREKGTSNAVTKVFDKLSRASSDSVQLNEEWAFRVGRFGGIDQFKETEFRLSKNDFKLNPQPILLAPTETVTDILDQYLRVQQGNFTIAPIPFTSNINPTKKYQLTPRTAGYVNALHVDYAVKTRDGIIDLDITQFEENTHVWVTFDGPSWTVLRYNTSKLLFVTDVNVVKTAVTIVFNRPHLLNVGDVFGIKDILNLEGFFKITSVPSSKEVVITISTTAKEPVWESSTVIAPRLFTEVRFDNYQNVDLGTVAQLTDGARLWIDKNESDNWEVVEKQAQFSVQGIADYGSTDPLRNGTSVVYVDNLTQIISSTPESNLVSAYIERAEGLRPLQILQPPTHILSAVNGVFGSTLAVSPDGKWLAVGSPNASGVRSDYQTDFEPTRTYYQGDIVLYQNKLWRALSDLNTDGSTLAFEYNEWEAVKIVTANDQGTNTGYSNQGVVSMYEWSGQAWVEKYSFVSPRQDDNEKYGDKISIGVDGSDYYMSVSAPGSLDSRGRVYLYKFAPLAAYTGDTITYDVTVADPLGYTDSKFYLNGELRPQLKFVVGNTYVFDQTDISNVFYPNPESGTVTNIHPLHFSVDSAIYTTGVTYFIDNRSVTYTQYLAGFANATTRRIQIEVTETTNSVIAYTSSNVADSAAGNNAFKKYPSIAREWQQIEDQNYRGIFDAGLSYTAGTIVWFDNTLWRSLEDQLAGAFNGSLWENINPVATQSSLPTSAAAHDSTQYISGLLDPFANVELVKQGDGYGTSMAMSRDGSILVVGAPTSDGQYFNNYKGVWSSKQEYREGDTVKYEGAYFELLDPESTDSSYTSTNQNPASAPWKNIGYVNNDNIISVANIIPGRRYTIIDVGNTNWEDIGFGANNTVKNRVLLDGSTVEQEVVPIEEVIVDNKGNTVILNPRMGASFIAIGSGTGTGTVKYSNTTSGKIFIYKRDEFERYNLFQTINSDALTDLDDTGNSETVNAGDLFGFAVDIDSSGTSIVVSSPLADINLEDHGAVYVFKLDSDSVVDQYRLKQKLQSYDPYSNEMFGFAVSISPRTERITVSAKNAPYKLSTQFDGSLRTRFDGGKTIFTEDRGYAGQVYVFELKDQTYLLSEKLDAILEDSESFGYSIDSTADVVIVGSPDYVSKETVVPGNFIVSRQYRIKTVGTTDWHAVGLPAEVTPAIGITFVAESSGTPIAGAGSATYERKIGITRIFRKDPTKSAWLKLAEETELVNIDLLKSIALFDDEKNIKIADLDIIDPNKLKILGTAEEEIKFKTPYDPAVYSVGTADVEVDDAQAWFEKHVGELWWNVGAAKWVNYEQGDIAYRVGTWNMLAAGASVDVYEWVESDYLPVDWNKLADTTAGIAKNISGTPLYGNDVYSVKEFINTTTGVISGTKYYFWVKNKTIVPQNVSGRSISAANVATLIENPSSSGSPFVAIIDADKFLAYNVNPLITGDSALVNIEYYNSTVSPNAIHTEYQLLTEGVADSLPSPALEQKWIDSLIGFNAANNPVPDPTLLPKQKYGIAFRPIQTMFVDRATALKITVDNINTILKTKPFADLIDFENLNKVDPIPSELLNLYDITVDTYTDLTQVGTIRIKPAVLSANIVDGKLDTIEVVDPGFGYRVAPPVEITGDGTGATATATIDSQGRISSVTVNLKGRKYTAATVSVRSFSVLVINDSTFDNLWVVYSWSVDRKEFFKNKVQSYDTTKYWTYADWYHAGYSNTTRIVKEIQGLYLEPTISTKVGDIIRVKEYANGGWALLERVTDNTGNILGNYIMVARQDGTINIDTKVYSTLVYDTEAAYDQQVYDKQPSDELRYILKAVKENIFVDDLAVEWNKLFFASMRYIFSEQMYVDWAFKTSFLNAIHNVGALEQKTNYKNDNLDSFREYLEEVKPYRTTIREYTSRYTKVDPVAAHTTDFDCPPVYDKREGMIVPVTENNSLVTTYPWKSWADNKGYTVTAIELYNVGSGYITPPKVVIEGDGTGATAKAYVSNGEVSGVTMLTAGQGYTYATASLVGGNGTSTDIAKAVAIIGNGKVRSFNMSVKFDRITKTGSNTVYTQEEAFTADGYTAVFNLNYPPTRDKTKITVTINDQIILDSDYTITFYKSSTDEYTLLRGKLILVALPTAGDVIAITYEKSDEILDAVDRINKHYNPTAGMLGKEVNQLMTGIDFGGVQIQGTTFDVSGGWDALPWFTDTWDSVESSSDYYYVTDGSTTSITLPSIPVAGQAINIYIKHQGGALIDRVLTRDSNLERLIDNLQFTEVVEDPVPVRLDDQYFGVDNNLITNANAVMPTFIGDGVTAVVEIGDYINTVAGDTLIFRPSDSDGTVTISDINIIDTKLSGGSLSNIDQIYQTAAGTYAEDIVVDGSKFISPDQVPAPEENVPGQVLDSVSIKVFHTVNSGAAPLNSTITKADGSTVRFDIGLIIEESNSVLVYADKIKCSEDAETIELRYSIDYITNEVVFYQAPGKDSIIEVLSVGLGGVELLDYQEFQADGDTMLFLTRANFADTQSVLVTVDGVEETVLFINSSDVVDVPGKTLIEFAVKPRNRQIVKIVCLGSAGLPLVRVNKQTFVYDGTTISFELDSFVNLQQSSAVGAMLVEVNGKQLTGVDTTVVQYDGSNNEFVILTDPSEPFNTATDENIKVFVNNEVVSYLNYVYNGTANTIAVSPNVLTVGDEIKVEVDLRSQYIVTDSTITLTNYLLSDSSIDLAELDEITVTWFSQYPSMSVISDQYTGGKAYYALPREPLSASYVWVYKNGNRLTQDVDYEVSVPRNNVYLKDLSIPSDEIKIVQFGNEIRQKPMGFEIFKDMLNVYHFKRFGMDKNVVLSKDLTYYDQEISVTDTTALFEPIKSRNIPGIVYINGERIEYFNKTATTLSQLRRGSSGTPIATVHSAGKEVVDVSKSESLPYNETQERIDFVSDGSSSIIGPLNFVPTASSRTNWTRDTIPVTYSPCDEIEVFVGGKRLRKDPVDIYTEAKGITSPAADEVHEAEFSVDGITPYIRLTNTATAGSRITIIRRVGKTWYDQGATTASAGLTLTKNSSPVLSFVTKKSTELPE